MKVIYIMLYENYERLDSQGLKLPPLGLFLV